MMWKAIPSDGCYLGYIVNSDARRYLFYYYNNNWNLGTGSNHATGGSATVDTLYDLEVRFKSGNSYLNVNGTRKITSTETFTATDSYANGMSIFALNQQGAISYKVSARCYNLKIYLNDAKTLVRDYVPALQLSSGKHGLYDLVNNQFYGSATSTDFIGGGCC